MTELDVWTPQEIADEIGMSRQFIINVILGKTSRYVLDATKKGRTWLIANDEAQAFVARFRDPQKEWYSPNDLAKAIGKSRKYVLDSLTGYGGRKEPRLAGTKRGDRWIVDPEEAKRFIGLHGNESD